MEHPLEAYVIESEDDGAVIAFGRNPMEARRLGANTLGLHYDDVTKTRRAPEYDMYANAGKVPVQDMIQKFGWTFQCWHCSANVDGDSETYDDDTDEWKQQDPVYGENHVFCSPECHALYEAEQARLQAIRMELREGLLARWPGVTPKSIFEINTPPLIHFTFPGGKCEGHWRLGEDSVLLSALDVEAWHAFQGKEAAQ